MIRVLGGPGLVADKTTGAGMARAISMVRREVFAGTKDQITVHLRDLAGLGRPIDLRRIVLDRTLHAALALAHLALAVAFTMAVGDVTWLMTISLVFAVTAANNGSTTSSTVASGTGIVAHTTRA